MSGKVRSIEGRVALVTGASRGIGKAVAELLASKGAFTVGTSKTAEGAAGIERMFLDMECSGMGLEFDLLQTESIRERLQKIVAVAGKPVSILVNNAGVTGDAMAMSMKESWDKVIDTNLTGTFRVTQAVGLGMLRGIKKNEIDEADIVTVGSVVGEIGEAGQVNYAAAKAGLMGMTKALAKEWPEVRVNIVNPGFVDTDMTSGLSSERIQQILDLTNSKKALTPEQIAWSVLDLIEQGSTGQVVTLDDGIIANLEAQQI